MRISQLQCSQRAHCPALDVTASARASPSSIMAKTHHPVDADVVMRELCRVDRHLARVIRKVGSFPTKKQKRLNLLLRAHRPLFISNSHGCGGCFSVDFGRVKKSSVRTATNRLLKKPSRYHIKNCATPGCRARRLRR